MPNYCPKGVEYMHELARRGGLKSGETRRLKKIAKILAKHASEKGIPMAPDPIDVPLEAGWFKRPNCSGGSHDDDWRCPYCHHWNSPKRRACANCMRPSPVN